MIRESLPPPRVMLRNSVPLTSTVARPNVPRRVEPIDPAAWPGAWPRHAPGLFLSEAVRNNAL